MCRVNRAITLLYQYIFIEIERMRYLDKIITSSISSDEIRTNNMNVHQIKKNI